MDVRDAWSTWLEGYRWDWFATLTFALPPSSRTSLRHFCRFARELQTLGWRPGYFVGSEVGSGGREHLHAVICFEDPRVAEAIRGIAWKWWFEHYGRALILPYDRQRGAHHYVSKYVTKGFAEYDVGGEWRPMNS